MLPQIERRLRFAFRYLQPEAREDAVEDGTVHCLLSYINLVRRGIAASVTPASLSRYAALQIRNGRQTGCRMNSKEPLSRYARLKRGFKLLPLDCGCLDDNWINDVVATGRASVADQVAIKLDFAAWLRSLCRRMRSITNDLAMGYSTSEVARKHHLSAGRISQLRRDLKASWHQFQGESTCAAVG